MNVVFAGEASAAGSRVAVAMWRAAAASGVVAVAAATWVALPAVLASGSTATAIMLAAACSVDIREHRLPNRLMAAAGGIVAATVVTAGALGDVDVVDAARGLAVGVWMSGAVLLGGVWLVRPSAMGGGDVKMLAVAGAMLGVADPRVALVAGWVGVVLGLVAGILLRRRRLPFGPALFAGYVVGAVSTLWFHSAVGTTS